MASSTRPAPTASARMEEAPRTYVLDTSVLLSDPRAITRFKEHEVVLPVVVVTELEAKRNHPELGYFARTALRMLDDLRISAGRLDAPVPIGDDGGQMAVLSREACQKWCGKACGTRGYKVHNSAL